MSITHFKLGRNLPTSRISAYECQVDTFGKLIRGKYVRGWYGHFTAERLQSEIMPKLAEYAAQGWSYPFLLTSHRLQEKATVHITATPRKAAGVKFSPRQRKSTHTQLALINSPTSFQLLSQ